MKKYLDKIASFFQLYNQHPIPFLMALAFLLWIYAFKGFVFAKLHLVSDASAYYEHFRYFIENISRGIYPMWEPPRDGGVPVEFFMRRIGAFNPLFLVLLFYKTGIDYTYVYLFFLGLYFFLGMIGFYLIAKNTFQNTLSAFAAFLLLTFSALGTRLFDSYILLTVIPMIWFFYFFISFIQNPQKVFLIGLTFCVMILLSTYIPFYFINIFIFFLIFACLIYLKKLGTTAEKLIKFTLKSKSFCALCLVLIIISTIPGTLFYLQGYKGEVILQERHETSDERNQLAVGLDTKTEWGFEEDMAFSYAYMDIRQYRFAVFYIPIWTYCLLLLGIFMRMNKRILLLFFWGVGLLLVFSHHLKIFDFLHDKIFYFKYFRNLHFFLWMAIIPIIVFFASEQFHQIRQIQPTTPPKRIMWILYIIICHILIFIFSMFQKHTHMISLITITLSLLFFLLLQLPSSDKKHLILLPVLLLVIIMEPMFTFHYLQKNSPKAPRFNCYRYGTDQSYLSPPKTSSSVKDDFLSQAAQNRDKDASFFIASAISKSQPFYFGSKWQNELRKKIDDPVLQQYLDAKFLLYDNIQVIADKDIDWLYLAKNLATFENKAYVSSDAFEKNTLIPELPQEQQNPFHAEILDSQSPYMKMLNFDINHIQFKLILRKPQFLIYAQNYHSGWKAFMDGKEIPIYRSNLAFQGLWVPPGEHLIFMQFGKPWEYVLNYSLLVIYTLTFLYLLKLCFFHFRNKKNTI